MKFIYTKESTGHVKEVKEGFSWTSLFFGIFVPIYRGDLVGFIFQLALAVFTLGWSWLIVPFFYNSRYRDRLLKEGYVQTGVKY